MYYTIQDGSILKAETEQALTRYYNNVKPLPIDYEEGKYIVDGDELVLNPNYEQELAEERKKAFLQNFFEIPNAINNKDLYYRRIPKGYSSAVESINTAFNIVATLGTLSEGSLIFYEEPDFTKEEECTEEWLVNHQVVSKAMTTQEFGEFYAKFIIAWNTKEHEN